MIGLIFFLIAGILSFVYLSIFHMKTAEKLDEYESIKFSRKKMHWLSKNLVASVNMHTEVVFEDEEDFKSLDPKKGIVFISNHASNFDIPAIVTSVPMDLGFVAKKEMETWPLISKWMVKSASVFLDRENAREGIKGIKRAVQYVKKGHPMVIFPQGTRTVGIQEGDFKKGSFKLAIDAGGIIVPLALIGSDKIQAPGESKVNMNRTVKVVICRSIVLSDLTEDEIKNINTLIEKKLIEKYKYYNF